MKSNAIIKLLVVIGAIWMLLQISFLPTLIFTLIALVTVVILLFVLGAAAIPGLILYGIGRAFGLFGGASERAQPGAGETIEGTAEAVEAEWREPPSEDAGGEAAPSPSIAEKLRQLIERHRVALSEPVIEKLESILRLIEELEANLDTLDRGSEQYHTVVETAESYVPEMLGNYLQLPQEFARNHQLNNGQTPRQVLLEQLNVLDGELRGLRNAAYERRSEALIAHGEFIKSKFKRPKPFLDLQ